MFLRLVTSLLSSFEVKNVLQCIERDGQESTLAARFCKPRKDVVTEAMLPASVALSASGEQNEQTIVIALMLHLKKNRGSGTDFSASSAAAAITSSAANV